MIFSRADNTTRFIMTGVYGLLVTTNLVLACISWNAHSDACTWWKRSRKNSALQDHQNAPVKVDPVLPLHLVMSDEEVSTPRRARKGVEMSPDITNIVPTNVFLPSVDLPKPMTSRTQGDPFF